MQKACTAKLKVFKSAEVIMPYKVMASGCIANDFIDSPFRLFNCVDWLISTLCVKNVYFVSGRLLMRKLTLGYVY